MAQLPKSDIAKYCILRIVSQHQHGIRYNALFDQVKPDIGSRMTFEKYLTELEKIDHAIDRKPDPEDSRAKLIVANPETTRRKMILLDGLKKIQQIANISPRKPSWGRYSGWKRFEKAFQEWKKDFQANTPRRRTPLAENELRHMYLREVVSQQEPIHQLVKTAHKMFIETFKDSLRTSHPDCKSPLDIYIRVRENMIEIRPAEYVWTHKKR